MGWPSSQRGQSSVQKLHWSHALRPIRTICCQSCRRRRTITWSSGGHQGRYKGSRKSTAFAAQLAARFCAQEALTGGMRKVEVWIKGPGSGREAAIRSLRAEGLEVSRIKDCTAIPHNGCRPKKRRRL